MIDVADVLPGPRYVDEADGIAAGGVQGERRCDGDGHRDAAVEEIDAVDVAGLEGAVGPEAVSRIDGIIGLRGRGDDEGQCEERGFGPISHRAAPPPCCGHRSNSRIAGCPDS